MNYASILYFCHTAVASVSIVIENGYLFSYPERDDLKSQELRNDLLLLDQDQLQRCTFTKPWQHNPDWSDQSLE